MIPTNLNGYLGNFASDVTECTMQSPAEVLKCSCYLAVPVSESELVSVPTVPIFKTGIGWLSNAEPY
jgi:hypothetical protein